MALACLVAHGVGQRLDRYGAVDPVAVQVQERVELGQAEPAMAVEDGYARRPQRPPPEVAMAGRQGSQGRLTVTFRPTTVVVVDPGPELLAQILEVADEGNPLVVERRERPVELAESGEQRVAGDLHPSPLDGVEGRCHPIGKQVVVCRCLPARRHRAGIAMVEEGRVGAHGCAPVAEGSRAARWRRWIRKLLRGCDTRSALHQCASTLCPPVTLGTDSAQIRCQASGSRRGAGKRVPETGRFSAPGRRGTRPDVASRSPRRPSRWCCPNR